MTWWNEKFRFEFPLSDWENLTHVKFRIMDLELFRDGGFVGETMYDDYVTELFFVSFIDILIFIKILVILIEFLEILMQMSPSWINHGGEGQRNRGDETFSLQCST